MADDKNIVTPTSAKTPKRSHFRVVTTALVLVFLVVSSGIYVWQHNKYTSEAKLNSETNNKLVVANKKLNSSDKQIKSLANQVTALDSSNEKLGTELKANNSTTTNSSQSLAASVLALTINDAEYVNPSGTVTQGSSWFGVNMTLTNNTSSSISVSDNYFKLEDLNHNQYPEETIIGASTLPPGWVSLNSPTLAPGETVSGSVTFQMPNTNVNAFTFIDGTKTFSITTPN